MRRSVALLLALMLALPLVSSMTVASASEGVLLAQEGGEDQEGAGSGEEGEGSEGQDDPAAETGGEGEEGEAAVEEGPVWTLQMAWITIAMLLLIFVAIGAAYYRFVAQRRKQGI